MSGIANGVRDEVYLRIATKRLAGDFYFSNAFVLEKTWRPWETLENLTKASLFPAGKVYVIGGRPGDIVVESRTNMATREYPVMIGFQHAISNLNDTDEIDAYTAFVEELEETCRVETDNNFLQLQFYRIEPLRDQNGVPFSFIQQRDANLFEAYFTAYFRRPLGSYNESTTTTT